MRPKILIGVSSSYCASFLKGQVAFLVHHGYDVVIISAAGEEIEQLAQKEQARLITIPFNTRISPLTDGGQLLQIIQILKKEQPDIINAGNPKSGFLITLAAWLTGHRNIIFTLHGLVSDTRSGFKKWLISRTEKLSCRMARRVVVVSPSLRNHAIKRNILSAGKAIVINNGSCNGVDAETFNRTPAVIEKASQLAQHLGLDPSDRVIGFVGRLSKDKGIDILLSAFNTLRKSYPNLKLLLVGPLIEDHGLPEDILKRLREDEAICFVGKQADVVLYYSLMEVLVLPSYREGLPNVLLEASAMELPVIATDIPGCTDAVKHQYTGELVRKASESDLVAVLERLLREPELGRRYGINGRQWVASRFNQKAVWQGYLQLYQQAVNLA